ncbi:MAG: amino acid permease [Kofleriaceae bacterium]
MTQRSLVRGLGFWGASSLVVGTIIGTGVFLKTAPMAQLAGSAIWVLVAWAAAGVLSLAGAMTYAELGAMFPAAGGEYVYLRRGYGPMMGYLYGWNRFWIATPGSVAAYAVGATTFLAAAIELDTIGGPIPIALAFVVVFSGLNLINVTQGGRLHTALTILKVVLVLALAAGALLAPHGNWSSVNERGPFPGWSAFGAMMISALWAYDGWNNLPMAAGEVRDPARNLPRAIVGGAIVVFAIYLVINLGYFHALPFDTVAGASSDATSGKPSVASLTAAQFFGDTTAALLGVAMALCALSAMNGSMLTGARVPYAMARDNLAPKVLGKLSDRARIPAVAVVVQGVLSCAFVLTSKFDQITNAVVFASWLFYALNAGSVLALRRRDPARPRPFRVPGFPVVPIVFVAVAVLLLVNTIYTAFWPSALGLAMTVLGATVYLVLLRGRATPLDEAD